MNKKDYKVEMKPSTWAVSLESGEYSDYEIDYLYFYGNSEDEIWNFLSRYLEDIYFDRFDDNSINKIYSEDGREYIVKKFIEDTEKFNKSKFDPECDVYTWQTKEVKMKRLDVIHFMR